MSRKPKRKKEQPASRPQPWRWAVIVGALLVFAGGLALVWQSSNAAPAEPPEVTGAPSLAVDQELIDEGYIELNRTIQTTFYLKNVGDQTLEFLGEPQVELAEGC